MTSQPGPDLTEEQNTHQAGVVARINRWCKLCEASVTQIADEYKRKTFEELEEVKALLPELTDPFYASAGRHCIINALCKAGRQSEAVSLFNGVTEDFIVEKVLEENPSLANEPSISALLNFRQLHDSLRTLRTEVRDMAEKEPPELPSSNEELRTFAAELAQQLSGLGGMVQLLSKKITILLWLVAVAALVAIFR